MKGHIMKLENAINYLKLLHTLERSFSTNILTQNEKELVAKLRAAFVKEYQGKKA